MAIPKPKAVFDDPEAHWTFITAASDGAFEGQHFDRKEACRPRPDGSLASSDFKSFRDQVRECVSAFANGNQDGGLLVLGVASTGEVKGLNHLSEAQINALTRIEQHLVHHNCRIRLFPTHNDRGEVDKVALIYVPHCESAICETFGSSPRAWIRRGPQNVVISEDAREQLKRNKRIVDYERIACCRFDPTEVDQGVLKEFKSSYLTSAAYDDWSDEELLYQVGAISREDGVPAFTNAGVLFFAANPRRVMPQAQIRLLRFDVPVAEREERPPPTYDKTFDGPITKQIRDFRTFMQESAFFKTYQRRNPDGGFTDEPEYPWIAVDEAVVNAVAHRDYAIKTPIICEKYKDAFIVSSPGILRQPREIPSHFSLDETRLDHLPRNVKLMEWLKEIKDARGAVYVRALREGTRQMRDQMAGLGLPAPRYHIDETHTEVELRNDAARREVAATGAAPADTTEFANLYLIADDQLQQHSRAQFDQRRREILDALAAKLAATGWFIDSDRFGTVTAHRQGMAIAAPEAAARIVRLYPAYTFQVRQYHQRPYLVADYTAVVQSVLTVEKLKTRFGAERLVGLNSLAKRDRWQPAKIIAIDDAFCRVHLHAYGREELVPLAAVIPRLSRSMIDEALIADGIPYDLSREIKQASLALQSGTARVRAERTQAVVEDLARAVFPLGVGGDVVSISTTPAALSKRAESTRGLRVETLSEPEVEFNMHRAAADIREGITRFGSYDHVPHEIELVPICGSAYHGKMQALIERLRVGRFKYRGAEKTFSTRLAYRSIVTAEPSEVETECRRLLEQYPNWRGAADLRRLVLVHCPKEGFAQDDECSPYYTVKRVLLEAGVPCQMVDTATLLNADYKDLNLALNIVAKTGIVPWVLPESIPDADFFVGLSYTQSRRGENERLMGFANVFNEYGRWEFYSGGTDVFSYSKRALHYEKLVVDTLGKLALSEEPTVCFHYSAKFSAEDRAAILRGARRIRPQGKYVFVWINTQHHVRLYDIRPETDGSLSRGRYVIAGPNQIYLSTTGYNPYRKTLGTPQVLEINVRVERPDGAGGAPADLRALANQILCLTKLNWASTDSLCGEPITTKYAGDIAYLTAAFMRQGGIFNLHPALERSPWFI